MPATDVTYADVKFTRPKINDHPPSSDDTTYSEVKILKSEQPVCPNCSQQQAGSNRKCHVTSERAALLVLSLLLVAAVIALCFTGQKTMRLEENITKDEYGLKENKSGRTMKTCPTCPPPPSDPLPSACPPSGENMNERCLKCEAGWEHHGGKCYYFTTTRSSWNESRDGCRGKGGDLVKIDSREEQRFLEERLRDKMEGDEDMFWIGLTDSEKEKTWLWADGSSLDKCLSFWSPREPDNWKGDQYKNPAGEDCVRMGEKDGAADLKCWFDRYCNDPHKSICEKAAETK